MSLSWAAAMRMDSAQGEWPAKRRRPRSARKPNGFFDVGWSFVPKDVLKAHRIASALPVNLDDLVKEVTSKQAAQILGCSKDTVFAYKEAGMLEWRNLAPPASSRPTYRFSLQSVLALRNTYVVEEDLPTAPTESPRRQVRKQKKYKHLDLGD
jgi:hypothetical protein